MANEISRRVFGAVAIGSGVALTATRDAHASPAVILAGIGAAVTLWNGYKMVEEVYNRVFNPEQRQVVIRERERVIERHFVYVPEYYGLRNPYRFREFADVAPGCRVTHINRPQFHGICCQGSQEAIFVTSGLMLALAAAIQALQSSYSAADACAYTRPARYWKPTQPWQSFSSDELGRTTEMSYYAPQSAVALQWSIPDRNYPASRGRFIVRDRESGRVVAEGETPLYNHS